MIGKLVLGLFKKVLPSVKKETLKQSAIDGLITKRGTTTKAEVMMALGMKYLQWLLNAFIAWSVVSGKVNIKETLQLLIN